MSVIYLDYQASTPVAPEAVAAMQPWLDSAANPHSPHALGRAARAVVEAARVEVAALLPPGGRVIFTSGATEALNLAIAGLGVGPVVAPATEHAAVLDPAQARGGLRIVPVASDGLVDPSAFAAACAGAMLATAMLVNNEIGVIQPVAALTAAAHAAGVLFLCDAVQGYGRVPIPVGVDLVALSAHKIHGPKGIGALWVRDGIALAPLIHGGGQEGGLRSGTLSPMLAAGFGAAARLMRVRAEADAAHVAALWSLARARMSGWTLNGSAVDRYRGNLNLSRPGLDTARLIADCRGVAFSAGSACASGSGRPSHVLAALGLDPVTARGTIRLGFGRYTTERELADALTIIDAAAVAQGVVA